MVERANIEGHSYNFFSGREFYRTVDRAAIKEVKGPIKNFLNLGSGDGENIKGLIEENKLASDFRGLALDIDRKGLIDTKRTLGNFNNKDYASHVDLLHASASPEENYHFPVKDDSQDLVIGLNMIHLLPNSEGAINESFRVLRPGKQLVLSSTYEYDRAKIRFPQMGRSLALTVAGTKRILKGMGIDNIPNPIDVAKHKEEEYVKMAKDAGFVNVKVENYPAEMDREDVRAISYDDFLEGAFPGVKPEITRGIVAGEKDKDGKLIKTGVVDEIFDKLKERGVEKLKRDWMILVAEKPQK